MLVELLDFLMICGDPVVPGDITDATVKEGFLKHEKGDRVLQEHGATQLVRAHKDAVNSLSGNGSTKLGTVSAAVAEANSTALECSKEIEVAMQVSMRNALGVLTSRSIDGHNDDFSIMKVVSLLETLKDEELQKLARDICAQDSTIKNIAEMLSETADAAEAAAYAANLIDERRREASEEFERLTKEYEKQMESLKQKVIRNDNHSERFRTEGSSFLTGERDQMVKQRDSAHQEAHLWRSELAKAREHAVVQKRLSSGKKRRRELQKLMLNPRKRRLRRKKQQLQTTDRSSWHMRMHWKHNYKGAHLFGHYVSWF
ncbi:hypothetical protein MLD38_033273 [Melastoma candidum]|uniref:Uncharacterized protein n=1 Tax=Melastoma candidum TaxID=119954 RepID=A0ACB9M8V5_9MYRT|nr:hypothetical protein MLD38_033273 [Melastoma candidum]